MRRIDSRGFWAVLVLISVVLLVACSSKQPASFDYRNTPPVRVHGNLRVQGSKIVDKNNTVVSLAGISLFWGNSGWEGEKYYNAEVVDFVRYKLGSPIIRIAMGVESDGGYLSDRKGRMQKVFTVADAAIKAGLYFIVDWHSHNADQYPEDAKEFFTQIALRYGKSQNLIYEIFNEPTGESDWTKDVKPYAVQLISTIRKIDPDNIIITGTPHWSQAVHLAAMDPITDFNNIAYAMHFYAGTHGLKYRLATQAAIYRGLPVIVTEWGAVDVHVKGPIDYAETKEWLEFMKKNQLIHCNWSLHDKDETSSMLKSGAPVNAKWTNKNFTESGLLVKKIIQSWPNLPEDVF